METRTLLKGSRAIVLAAVLMIAYVGGAHAGHGYGGGGGGSHGGGFRGGFHSAPAGGGHFAGPTGWRGPGRGGYYGWHGYYGGYPGWAWGGWGWFGLGVYVSALPFGYQTLWWGDVPYYYADNGYYVWDDGAGQYQQVEPPAGMTAPSSTAVAPSPASLTLFAYPKGGQSEPQQLRDRDECQRWAASKSGFDPAKAADAKPDPSARQDYLRAQAACLEARNYTVR